MRASPSGKASAFQADIRGFESHRPLSPAGPGGCLLSGLILPPYYSLHILPFVVPQISSWKRRLLLEKDLMDAMF
jgi:hypothetical protein